MDPRFTLTTVHDKESYRNMVTVNYIVHQKAPIALFFALAVALAVFLWWGGAQANQYPSTLISVLALVIYTGILCCLVPYLDRFAIKRVSGRILKTMLKNVKDLGVEVHMTFGDTEFTVETPQGTTQRPYTALTKLCQTRGYFVLFEGKQAAYTLAKKGFTQGTAEEFMAFVAGACSAQFQTFDL